MPRYFCSGRLAFIGGLLCIVVVSLSSAAIALAQDDNDLRDPDRTTETRDLNRCADPACQRALREIAATAALTAEGKQGFVTALRRFVEALPAPYGDEGSRLRTALVEMTSALARWDEALERYRAALDAVRGAQAHLALGSVYLDRGLMSKAVDQLRRAADLAPTTGEVSLLLGLAYDALGKQDEAARAIERAVRAEPGNPVAGYASVQRVVTRGDETATTSALLEFNDRLNRSAEKPARTVIFLRVGLLRETAGTAPVFVPAQYSEGIRLLLAQRYDEAVVVFRHAIERDPVAAANEHLNERAGAGKELRDGRLPQSIARLERAVAQWPASSEVRRLLAAAYAADDRHAESIEQLLSAVQQTPDDDRLRVALAEALVASGRSEAAEQVLTDAVVALPESAQIHYRLGRLYQSQARVPDAIKAFEATASRPVLVGRDFLYETIAALRVTEGDFSAAIAAYRRELNVNPNNTAAHRRLGDLYSQEGRLNEALAEFAVALLIDPNDADAHASRAQTLLRMSRFDDAHAAARRAVALNPAHEGARYALGSALMRIGRHEEGLAALREFERLQAATRARNEVEWQLKLVKEEALAHASRQDYRQAADVLRRALPYAPADGSVQLAAGAFLVKAGAFADAVSLLMEALERGATEAHRYLAEGYAALGRAEESQRHRAAYDTVKTARLRREAARP